MDDVDSKHTNSGVTGASSTAGQSDRFSNIAGSEAKNNHEGESMKTGQTGMIFEDNIENKTYMIKSSGTIIDVNRKKKKMRKIPMSVRKPVASYLYILKSPFKGRGPTLFFPYPSYVNEQKDDFHRIMPKYQDDIGSNFRFRYVLIWSEFYNQFLNSFTYKLRSDLLANHVYLGSK